MPNPLAVLFLPKRRLAAAEPLVLQRGGVLGGTQWVVPRGECQYRRHDFSAVPPRQRQAAAALHLQRYLPTSDAVARIGWLDGVAHFWIWERPLAAVLRSRQKWLPESVLRRPALANGLHLLRCESGVEGQAWRDGNLVASQWWPQSPPTESWQRFVRGTGIGIDQTPGMPAVQQVPLSAYPWAQMQPVRTGQLANAEFVIWTATLGLLAAAAGWQLASLQEWRELREAQEKQLAALRMRAGPILDARDRAEAAAGRLHDMQAMLNGVSDYDLIADIVRPLPARTRLASYLRESGKISAALLLPGAAGPSATPSAPGLPVMGVPGQAVPRLAIANVDLRRMVSMYEGHPLLTEASATPAVGGVLLEFKLPAVDDEDAARTDAEARAR